MPEQQKQTETDETPLTVPRSKLKSIVEQIFEELFEEKFNNFLKEKFEAKFEALKSEIIKDIPSPIHSEVHPAIDASITRLEHDLTQARIDLNQLEQHSRRWAIRVNPLQAPVGNAWDENAKLIASNFLRENLKMNVPVSEIDCAHRVGRVQDGEQPMLVKFFRRDTVDEIIRRRRQLKGKGYVIHEDSTILNRKLLNRLHNHAAVDQCWLIRGVVWAKSKAGVRFKVQLFDDINLKIAEANSRAHQSSGRASTQDSTPGATQDSTQDSTQGSTQGSTHESAQGSDQDANQDPGSNQGSNEPTVV